MSHGLSQTHLANTLGVSQQAVAQWEQNLRIPRRHLPDLAALLHLDLGHLAELAAEAAAA